MKLDTFCQQVNSHVAGRGGCELAELLSVLFFPKALRNLLQKSPPAKIAADVALIKAPEWRALMEVHLRACEGVAVPLWHDAFAHQARCVQALVKIYAAASDSWSFPVLWKLSQDLWMIAVRSESPQLKEEAARQLLPVFNVCLNDRSGREDGGSRKIGVYHVTNLMFRVYGHLDQFNLMTNMLRVLANGSLLSAHFYPKAQRCEFHWHCGRYYMLREEFAQARSNLLMALSMCHSGHHDNVRMIYRLLVPVAVLTDGRLPGKALRLQWLDPHTSALLRHLYSGDRRSYARALRELRPQLAHLGTYALWHRLGSLWLTRCLFQRVHSMLGGLPRLSLDPFKHALALSNNGAHSEGSDDVEVLSAFVSLIQAGLVKAYVALARRTVVLSAKDPFPLPTGSK